MIIGDTFELELITGVEATKQEKGLHKIDEDQSHANEAGIRSS
ncbi:hypothetical protein [Mesobacillus foraminis]|nr:hypothetical protein [Mesobacillus foraminis]